MPSMRSRPFLFAVALLSALAITAGDAFAGPFTPLAGDWVGSGILILPGGTRERIRCRANYAVSVRGDALRQVLRCASDSYRVEISSDAIERGGIMSGRWAEATFGAAGVLTGTVHGPVIQGIVSGAGVRASLSLVTRGRTQSVVIQVAGGFGGVMVTFHRD